MSSATINAMADLFNSLDKAAQDKILKVIGAVRPEVSVVNYGEMTVLHGLRHYIGSQTEPVYYRDLPEILGCALSTVSVTLSSHPEFISDRKGNWRLSRY